MRHVGDLPTHEQAQRFADYLLVRDVKVNIDQEDGQWAIWAVEEDETQEVKQELERFRENPDGHEYQGHGSTAQRRRKEEEKTNREFRRNQIDVRTRWGRGRAGIKAGPVTLLLIVVSVIVGLLTQLGADKNEVFFSLMFEKWTLINGDRYSSGLQAIRDGQIWRIFTPMFVHYGPMHLIFNMLWLNQLGAQIESRLGKWKYLLLVLEVAAVAHFSQYLWSDWSDRHGYFGGMSGVVYGLFGYIWMKAKFEPQERYLLTQQTVTLMIGWMFLCMTGFIGPIANAAHVMGLVSGVAFGYAPTFFKKHLS
jgi:GlpG protein